MHYLPEYCFELTGRGNKGVVLLGHEIYKLTYVQHLKHAVLIYVGLEWLWFEVTAPLHSNF